MKSITSSTYVSSKVQGSHRQYVEHGHFELTLLSTTFVELLSFLVVDTLMKKIKIKITKDIPALANGESVCILSMSS